MRKQCVLPPTDLATHDCRDSSSQMCGSDLFTPEPLIRFALIIIVATVTRDAVADLVFCACAGHVECG